MDTKIKSRFWSDPEVEELDANGKLSLLWLLTSHINDCGYAECSQKRYEWETGSPWQALLGAVKALGKSIIQTGKGFFVVNYVREQIGQGENLAKNNMAKAAIRACFASPEEVQTLFLESYPELQALAKPYLSPSSASGSTREERRGEERSQEGGLGETHPAITTATAIEFPPGFPETAEKAVTQLQSLALPDVPDAAWIREVWDQIVSRGFKDAAGVRIVSLAHHVNKRWTREKAQWLASQKMASEKKERGAQTAVQPVFLATKPATMEVPPEGWEKAAESVLGWVPDEWSLLPADSKAQVRGFLNAQGLP